MVLALTISPDPEDKQVLIDSDTENNEENDEVFSTQSSYVEVPLSLTQNDHQNSNDNRRLNVNTLDFATEYENQAQKVTFQRCSDPIDESYAQNENNGGMGIFNTFFRRILRVARPFQVLGQGLRFHKKLLISSSLVVLGSSGCLIFFPLHLENVSRGNNVEVGDGYSACLSASTITTLLFLFNCIFLEVLQRLKWVSGSVLKPLVGSTNLLKVGFCLGLSFVTIFYSWEDDKVPCNFQDPLLGLIIIFAIITHAVCRWRSIGLKRTFALSTIAAGVFLSVDYPLVDHHRCRGYYYRSQMGDIVWSWKVHLVWTLAFVVSIWLATVAAFFLESSIPVPKVKHSRLYDLEYNAVKLRVMKPNENEPEQSTGKADSHLKSYRFNPYTNFHLSLISNAVLWFSITTWIIILSLFWTVFIPGFGKGINIEKLPDRVLTSFGTSLTSSSSWGLFGSLFIFCHAFTYLTILTRSPIASISVGMMGFPIIGLWWSFFQIQYSFFVWMPVFSGELLCASLGFLTVCTGCYHFIKFEILKPARALKRAHHSYTQHY